MEEGGEGINGDVCSALGDGFEVVSRKKDRDRDTRDENDRPVL